MSWSPLKKKIAAWLVHRPDFLWPVNKAKTLLALGYEKEALALINSVLNKSTYKRMKKLKSIYTIPESIAKENSVHIPNKIFLDNTEFDIDLISDKFLLSYNGFCPVCQSMTTFSTQHIWLRDFYICTKCKSLPRDRQIFKIIYKQNINFDIDSVLELSPGNNHIKNIFKNYKGSFYYPDKEKGSVVDGFYNEDIQNMTFDDNTFDIVIHEDVFEHIFNPVEAIKEIYRILKVGGKSIFCFPIYENLDKNVVRAKIDDAGNVSYILKPMFHGNPIDNDGALVVYEYGHEILNMLYNAIPGNKVKWTHVHEPDPSMGIAGKCLDCFMLEKIS